MATKKNIEKEIKQDEIIENKVIEQEQNIDINETVAKIKINPKDEKYFNIEYKKYNPFIFGNKLKTNHKFHLWYNIIKFSIILITIVFGLLALWFSTKWEETTDEGFISTFGYTFLNEKFFTSLGATSSEVANNYVNTVLKFKPLDFNVSNSIYFLNDALPQLLIAFSFIGIVMSIPTMVFKNGTAWSLGALILLIISMVIIVVIFALVLNTHIYIDSKLSAIEKSYKINQNGEYIFENKNNTLEMLKNLF